MLWKLGVTDFESDPRKRQRDDPSGGNSSTIKWPMCGVSAPPSDLRICGGLLFWGWLMS